MSPFCVKLETYLRMVGLEYEVAPLNPRKAPKGKVPYVEIDGKLLGDSELIIELLKERYGDPLDAALSAAEKAQALAIRRLVEDHLYFVGAWLRWSNEDSWAYVAEVFRGILPPIVGRLLLGRIRKIFLNTIYAQGMGRHSHEEILRFGKADIEALSTLLADKPFFLGEKPTSLDATLYGFLVQTFWVPWDSPLRDFARKFPNLEAYCERMKARYWN